MTEYGLDFLEEKGFLESSIDMEDRYDTAEGDVKAVSYRFDSKNRLAYFDDFNVEDIASILKVLRKKRNFDYYWFWKEGRIYAFRTFGENKQFIFNTRHSRKTEYIKSKKDKLSKFSSENPTALFEVKDVISRFYRRLWDLRLKLAKAIKGGLDDRERILAAQRLLDRLIFTYFIAEKGIIYGIDKRGRRQELSARNLFKYLIEVSGDFHGLLNVLFFEYLNDSKKNDMPVQGAEGYSLFIPYLNGGLFRERHITTPAGESIGESELEIEGFDWKELIDALNEYNWIIDGYTDAEAEETIGNLTPEILGHIYEKFVISVSELDDIDVSDLATTREGELKKGNKKIGAYYTPEVITKYIAENTIFPFAMDKLELDEKYENFVEFHEAHKADADTLSRFNDALKDIKVLDPAVGSGAFPMAAADILFDWRRKCNEKLDDYHLRREIIINNLHGVDIMEGAVEICMLRLWLWLIAAVDAGKEIEALPNIDFNIFEGNSLIGYVNEKEVVDLKQKKKRKARWETLTHKQFTIDNWGEEGIFKLFQQRNGKIREYRNASGERAERLRDEIKQMTDEFNGLLDSKLLKELQDKKIEIDENGLAELKPFHWVMQFSDVFENGGFDVVIGNPPYVRQEKISNLKPIFSPFYSCYNGIADLYVYFYERGINSLKENGLLGYISSNKWMKVKYGKEVRIFLKNLNIKSIIDFYELPVFDVSTEPAIIIVKKRDSSEDLRYLLLKKLPQNDLFELFISKHRKFEKDLLENSGWNFVENDVISIMKQVKQKSVSLEEYTNNKLFYGLKTGLNKAFIIDKEVRNKLIKQNPKNEEIIKPYLRGTDIQRYYLISDKQYFLATGYDLDISNEYPSVYEHLLNFEDALKKRCDKGANWYNLRACSYYQEFEKTKIVYIHTAVKHGFYLDINGYYLNNSSYFISKDDKYLLCFLNSKLFEFYKIHTFVAFGDAKGRGRCKLDYNKMQKVPIKKIKKNQYRIFDRLANYMLFLNETEDRRKSEKSQITFIDEQIIDCLIFSIYFSSKFTTDGIPTDLAAKVAPHLEPIEYDRWAQLEFKDELTGAEMEEKQALEEKNMAVIERVYQRLRDDKEIQGRIRQIKAHPWVRVVEGETT